MTIVLKPGSTNADIDDVSRRVGEMGFKTHLSRGEVRTIIGVVGDDRAREQLLALQSLKPDRFAALMAELRPLAQVLGRSL